MRIIFILLILLLSCQSNNKIIQSNDSKLKIVRYMGTVYNLPKSLDVKTFWQNKEEHVFFYVYEDISINEELIIYETKDKLILNEPVFAFINKKDTFYSDADLNVFIRFKKDNIFYYNTINSDFVYGLKESYSFFRKCW